MATSNSSKATDTVTVILAAAKACYLQLGIDKTGMEDIARVAGVARSTLYRYFPRHDVLLLAVVSREMQAMNAEFSRKMARYKSPEDKIVEGLIMSLHAIPRHPLLSRVFAKDEGGMLRQSLWNSPALVQYGTELMAAVLQEARDKGRLQEAVPSEMLVEWVYRILLSFLSLPSNWVKSDQAMRTTLHALLIPAVLKPASR